MREIINDTEKVCGGFGSQEIEMTLYGASLAALSVSLISAALLYRFGFFTERKG